MRNKILALEESVLQLDLKEKRRKDFNDKVINYLNKFIDELNTKKVSDLQLIAKKLNIKKLDKLNKEELTYAILDYQAEKNPYFLSFYFFYLFLFCNRQK